MVRIIQLWKYSNVRYLNKSPALYSSVEVWDYQTIKVGMSNLCRSFLLMKQTKQAHFLQLPHSFFPLSPSCSRVLPLPLVHRVTFTTFITSLRAG